MTAKAADQQGTGQKGGAPNTGVFSNLDVLARLRGTLTGWVTALTSIAAVVFTGLSLGEYVKAPATADGGIAAHAKLSLLLVILGVSIILGASGWASSLRAAPQDGAFRDSRPDPLRFFPRNSAPELLQEYKDEVARFNAARLRDDADAMKEAASWMNLHSQRLWQWLEAYRTRAASDGFQRAAVWIAAGVLLAGVGTVGFADALRLMKSPLPEGVVVQGPRTGSITLLGSAPSEAALRGLTACTTIDTNGQQSLPVTVMKVVTPTADQKKKGIEYIASVVPPMTGADGCKTEVYEVTSLQARVLVTPEQLTDAPAPGPSPTTVATAP